MDNAFGLLGAATPALFAADDAAGGLGGMMCCLPFFAVMALVVVLSIVIGWKIFTKAGRPGWESIVPIYSHWVLVTEICKKEPLWFFLAFIPIGNIIAAWVICQELAKKFGKSEAFGIGLFFLGPVFAAILAFGDAKYRSGRSRDYDDEDEDDEDEDDRPRKKRRDEEDEEDEDDDDRPRKRR